MSKLTRFEKAERVLKGYCSECYSKPGTHEQSCSNWGIIKFDSHTRTISFDYDSSVWSKSKTVTEVYKFLAREWEKEGIKKQNKYIIVDPETAIKLTDLT